MDEADRLRELGRWYLDELSSRAFHQLQLTPIANWPTAWRQIGRRIEQALGAAAKLERVERELAAEHGPSFDALSESRPLGRREEWS